MTYPRQNQGRYSQTFILDGKRYTPKYFSCATQECQGKNLDTSDPGTQAYLKAMDAQLFKDISTAASYGSLAFPLGTVGATLSVTGVVASTGSVFTDSSAIDEILKYGSQEGAKKVFENILKHPPAAAARAATLIELAGGWEAFAHRIKVDLLEMPDDKRDEK